MTTLALTLETKIKYTVSLLGILSSFGIIVANDMGALNLKSTDFYKMTLAACSYTFGVTNPKYKTLATDSTEDKNV